MEQVGRAGYRPAAVAPNTYEAAAYNRLMQLSATITREGDWFVAQCREFDVASQGATEEQARANPAEALTLYFEGTDTDAGSSLIVAPLDIAV